MNEEIAELIGAILGDGCLSTYWDECNKRQRYDIVFTGHTHDYKYYTQNIIPTIRKNFGIKGYLRLRKDDNTTRYAISSKRVFEYFKKFKIPIGKKGPFLKIPKEILQKRNLKIACIRGIFDTDGTIYSRYSKAYSNHPKKYDYGVIQFTSISRPLITQIHGTLKSIGIKPYKISVRQRSFATGITDQKEIIKFFRTIKPNNKHHLQRYRKIMGPKGFEPSTSCLRGSP